MSKHKATWQDVFQNPTLYADALEPGEGERLKWQDWADVPHSSQVFCISAFGSLRRLAIKNAVVTRLLATLRSADAKPGDTSDWQIRLEVEDESLLNERGTKQPTSLDAQFESVNETYSVETKLLRDAEKGFGVCGQIEHGKCRGFYGPGSDSHTKSQTWCRLEIWDRERSPRLYWSLGRAFFQTSIFAAQLPGEECPFAGSNYQLMRTFLFSAAQAQRNRKRHFGLLVVCPRSTASLIEKQVAEFRAILLPQFQDRIQLQYYEDYLELLRATGDSDAIRLANFLQERMTTLLKPHDSN